jgi:hypothetical protein
VRRRRRAVTPALAEMGLLMLVRFVVLPKRRREVMESGAGYSAGRECAADCHWAEVQ